MHASAWSLLTCDHPCNLPCNLLRNLLRNLLCVQLGSDVAHQLAESLSRGGMPRIEQLLLNGNALGSNGTIALVDAFRSGAISRNLRVLNLHSNEIGNEGAAALHDALQQDLGTLAALQEVNLANNPINASVRQQLAATRPGLVVR